MGAIGATAMVHSIHAVPIRAERLVGTEAPTRHSAPERRTRPRQAGLSALSNGGPQLSQLPAEPGEASERTLGPLAPRRALPQVYPT